MSSSLARVTCETSQVLLVGGQVVFLRDLPFLPHLMTDSAQNEWNNLDRAFPDSMITLGQRSGQPKYSIGPTLSCYLGRLTSTNYVGHVERVLVGFLPNSLNVLYLLSRSSRPWLQKGRGVVQSPKVNLLRREVTPVVNQMPPQKVTMT